MTDIELHIYPKIKRNPTFSLVKKSITVFGPFLERKILFLFLCQYCEKCKKRSDFSLFNVVSKALKFVALIFGEWTLGNNVMAFPTEI